LQKTDTEESMSYEHFDSILHALKMALNSADLIPESQWNNWSHRLLKLPIAKQYVDKIAKQIKLPWPRTKEFETLDMYLGQPISKISKKLGLKYLRTIISCVVHAAYDRLPEMQSTDSVAEFDRPSFKSLQPQRLNLTFDENIDGVFVNIKTDKYGILLHDLPPWLWLCVVNFAVTT